MREAVAATMQRAVPAAVDAVSRVADAKLRTMAPVYKRELEEAVQATPSALVIELTGFAKELETGFPARDMKPALLASPLAKTSKSGSKYIDIPFRHKLTNMSEPVRTSVQRAVRAEREAAQDEDREVKNPMRVLGNLPGATNSQQRYDKKGKTKTVDVQHKTSIYSDMFRVARNLGGRTMNTYQTIRRVSAKSDPQSWWHPGFEGIRALKQAESDIRNVLKVLFKSELQSRGLKTK